MLSCSQFLIQQLELWGVEHVFGIPGVHTIELYRSLEGSGLRHLSPRHEQGAGFMADGYARASGKPGVCFIITGPGMSNIMTAMGQALADSVPMLVVSSVGRLDTLGSRQGRLHELASQRDMVSNVARFSQTILDPEQLPGALARAFALFKAARPGPVHIEIPIDLLDAPLQTPLRPNPPLFYSAGVTPQAIETAASWLTEASRPLLLIGGAVHLQPHRFSAWLNY
ncbi:thiamine pyrophosphate-binding protein [Paenalcaligenes niemegkensis]|uniref:thiamine pyrophosphate-binding protein n=1 Tax=Paenalcaligenes niemegkensis TaxID=2895469 RepID=UPI001EE93A25|nr:thiamine pyrophosphate-binding protein [Paenalcaligenes niemegkensis]MCQ9616035.1 thiamine pyrophosphate-binding protein [Paenalcaligenes niemegkensis]